MNIMIQVWKELLQIPIDVYKAIIDYIDNIFSQRKPKSLEEQNEQITEDGKRQRSMLRSNQDWRVYDARVIRELRSENLELKMLLEQRDKEIKALKAKLRSLEIEKF